MTCWDEEEFGLGCWEMQKGAEERRRSAGRVRRGLNMGALEDI
jgi:hypothetical protein